MKWSPIQECKKLARTRRGFYKCAGCEEEVPASLKVEGSRRRSNNIHVDHIKPIIDPAVGWTTWDDCIENMFCELDNLQVLCTACHKVVTDEEKGVAKRRRAQEKLNAED
jgi:5-methylcytosine-specific restriction endonuclease McrA